MLNENAIDNLIQPIIDRQESINMFVINKIANRLRDVKELRPSDIKSLKNMAVVGADIREINKELAKQSNLQVRDIKNVIKIAAQDTYKDVKPFYDYRHKSYIPFEKNTKMQKIVTAIGNQTRDTYKNLSNSSAIGFTLSNHSKLKFYKLDDAYRKVIDEAIQASVGGLVNTDDAIRYALKQLLDSGIRRVHWNSGYTQRLDTAVRRDILDGIRNVRQQIQDEAGKQFGADGKELSAHSNCAPDHEPFQGHIFTNDEWWKLQSSADFKDVDGQLFTGVDRIIGVWNCHHIAQSIIIGTKKPKYTKEQLQKFIDDNHKGYTLPNGKHLTMHECTQMQRRLETRIRYAKEEQMAMKELGDKTAMRLARQKVTRLTNEYKLFSKRCGLTTKMKRTFIPNYTAY